MSYRVSHEKDSSLSKDWDIVFVEVSADLPFGDPGQRGNRYVRVRNFEMNVAHALLNCLLTCSVNSTHQTASYVLAGQ